jgi:hypothetical protein
MKGQKITFYAGIAWYSEDEWKKMKEISIDGERIENSFNEWEEVALKLLNKMRGPGFRTRKVYIKTDEFKHWCKVRSLPLKASSRSRYVSEIIAEEN